MLFSFVWAKYAKLRAFDGICMEKARYKILFIIVVGSSSANENL